MSENVVKIEQLISQINILEYKKEKLVNEKKERQKCKKETLKLIILGSISYAIPVIIITSVTALLTVSMATILGLGYTIMGILLIKKMATLHKEEFENEIKSIKEEYHTIGNINKVLKEKKTLLSSLQKEKQKIQNDAININQNHILPKNKVLKKSLTLQRK